jgi:diguanylate cyclase (GGDEF)-like protein
MNQPSTAPTLLDSRAEELDTYKRYLEALEGVTSQLLDSTDDNAYGEIVHIIGEVTGANICILFLDCDDKHHSRIARPLACWARSAGKVAFSQSSQLHYERYTELADTLSAGMLFLRNSNELPAAEKHLFAPSQPVSVLCIPMLAGGEPEGFLAVLSPRPRHQWHPVELKVLTALTTDVAFALMQQRSLKTSKANHQRLESLVGATEDMVFEFDEKGIILNVWGSHPALPAIEFRGKHIKKALPSEIANTFIRLSGPLIAQGSSETVKLSLQLGSNRYFFIARLQAVPDESGDHRCIVAQLRDVSDLMQEEARQKTMLETLNMLEEAVVDLTPEGVLLNTTRAWAKLRGIDVSDIEHDYRHLLSHWIASEDRDKLQAAIDKLARGEISSSSVRFRMPQPANENLWIEAKLIAHHAPGGSIVSLRGILRDITAAYLHEKHITQLALYDSLTHLPNRMLLDDHLHQSLVRAKRNNLKVALGFIDLDHFKQINDTFGHTAGDQVLINLSKQLRSVLRDIDTLARWGGDEFVVLIPDLATLAPLRTIAERLREIAREGVMIDGLETRSTISIGIAVYPDDAEDDEALMSAADSTMYYAKTAGRNNVQFYSDIGHLRDADRSKLALQSRLNTAIEKSAIEVFYQPIVHPHTGKVVALEALARWHDEQEGWVSPALFIPMAEKLGLIKELGFIVIEQALATLRHWYKLGHTPRLAINISRAQLFSRGYINRIIELVHENQLKPNDIELEVTESVALTDYTNQSMHLQQLAEAGFRIAIDDFGTGYSSLSQLHNMPVDTLKIDISFTSRLHTQEGQRVVQAIVQMAQALGLEIVAEGVERSTTASFLQGLGVKQMQGYYYGKPDTATKVSTLLKRGVVGVDHIPNE